MRNLLFIVALATGLAVLAGCTTYFAKPQPNNGVPHLTEIPAEFTGILRDTSSMKLDIEVNKNYVRFLSDSVGTRAMVGRDVILGMHKGYLIVNIIKPISHGDTVYTAFAFRVDPADKNKVYGFICTPDSSTHVRVASRHKAQDTLVAEDKHAKKKAINLVILNPTGSEFDKIFTMMEAMHKFAVFKRELAIDLFEQ